MESRTITSKGQVTIPKALRDRMGLRGGDRVKFHEEDGRVVLEKDIEESPFDKWVGILGPRDQTPDEIVEEMRGR